MNPRFWNGKRVFVTGHTGFKGGWLSLWLQGLGAELTGYSLQPPTKPSLFEVAEVGRGMTSIVGDVRDFDQLRSSIQSSNAEIVFHMAAQPLVRESYKNPIETYSTNVMGTVNLLEAVRFTKSVKAVVNVTTDKCYENKEWNWGYREIDALGGVDPYSNSKACSELVSASYNASFFNAVEMRSDRVGLATARAGNVIGGGDWASDRLIPDIISSFENGSKIKIRNPTAIRPWQHVLEPLRGYIILAEKLASGERSFAGSWNFGPSDSDAKSVQLIAEELIALWGGEIDISIDSSSQPHEAKYLKLETSKSRAQLGWATELNLSDSLSLIIDWVEAYRSGANMRDFTLRQISDYQNKCRE